MSSSNGSASVADPKGIPEGYLLSQIVVALLTATPAVISNVILLTTISRGQLWRTPVTLLVINLSVCDLMSGMVPGFGSVYYDIVLFMERTRKNLLGARLAIVIAAVITNIVSSCTVAAMAFDRLFAVSSPLHYKTRVTKTKIKVFIAVSWIYAVLFASLARVLRSKTVFILLYCHLHVTLPLIVLPVVYWKTCRALRSHNNQVRNMSQDAGQMSSAHRNRERKTISAFLMILFLFYVTFAPQYISQNMLIAEPSLAQMESFNFFLYTSNKFLLVKCSLNPFIYAWRIPQYRKAFKTVFSGFRCPKKSDYNAPETVTEDAQLSAN